MNSCCVFVCENNRIKNCLFPIENLILERTPYLSFECEVVVLDSVVVTTHTEHVAHVAFGYDDVDGLVVVEDDSDSWGEATLG